MATFFVKSRITHPIEVSTVDAFSRDDAIAMVVKAAKDAGDEVEVMDAREDESASATGPSGTTGGTGAATASKTAPGPTGAR